MDNSGRKGGYLVGNSHAEGGIPIKVKTGSDIEVEGGEVVITKPAVDSNTKHVFDGQMLTNRQILSAINVSGGGVSFADGGEIPDKIMVSGKEYEYDGNQTRDHKIVENCGLKSCGNRYAKEGMYVNIYDDVELTQFETEMFNKLKSHPHKRFHISNNDKKKLINLINSGKVYCHHDKKHSGVVNKVHLLILAIPDDKTKRGGMSKYAKGGQVEERGMLLHSDIPVEVKRFMPLAQQKAIVGSEEHWDVIDRLAKIVSEMPKTYETDDIETKDKVLYLHYFLGNLDWYVAEKDSEPQQLQMYGWANLGDTQNAEWGYMSMEEFNDSDVELDFYFEPITFSKLKSQNKRFNDEDEDDYGNFDDIYAGEIDHEMLLTAQAVEEPTFLYYKGVSGKYENAFEVNKAIEELLDYRGENGDWDSDEKQFLMYYSGYGGLEKFGAKGEGLLYEYFTPDQIVKRMWGLAYKHGFKGGSVLEPSVGVGNFVKYAPSQHLVTGYEINKYSAMITRILYPKSKIYLKSFEELFINNNNTIKGKIADLKKYSLVIGNPPYGKYKSYYGGMGEAAYTKAQNFIDYFIFRGLDLLESGGLLIYIIGAEVAAGGVPFLEQEKNSVKEAIAEKADLVDAYRLPNGVFDRTDVLSDIIVLKKK